MSEKLRVSYARVSTAGQNLDRQTFNGVSFDRDYKDKVSGSVPFAERPAGKRLLSDVLKGEVGEIHFHEVSRVGRDVFDITITLQTFVKAAVQVIIHKEGITLLNDDGSVNPVAQLVLAVMTSLAQIERQQILERQAEGIAIAKAKGKYLGRRAGSAESAQTFLAKPKSQRILKLLEGKLSQAHVAKIVGCSPVTVAKVKRVATEEGEMVA